MTLSLKYLQKQPFIHSRSVLKKKNNIWTFSSIKITVMQKPVCQYMQVQIHPNQLQSVWSHNSNHLNRFSSHFSYNTIIGCSVLTQSCRNDSNWKKMKSFNCIKFRYRRLIFAHKNNLTFSVWKKSVSQTVLAACLTKWNILHLRLCMPNMYTRNEQNSPSVTPTKFKTRHNSNIQYPNCKNLPWWFAGKPCGCRLMKKVQDFLAADSN